MLLRAASILVVTCACLCGCGSGNSASSIRDMDRYFSEEMDKLEASLKAAKDSEQEREALSKAWQRVHQLNSSWIVVLYDAQGDQVPASATELNERLKGGRAEISIRYRDGLKRVIDHKIIDSANVFLLLRDE